MIPALPPTWVLSLFGALLGVIIGSFIATLVLRWPAGRAVNGRSACDACGRTLSAIDLIPLVSYAALRGRARCCGTRIAPLHPLTEALAAIIGMIAFMIVPPSAAFADAIFGWLLLTLALLDWRHFWLPERLTIALALVGLAVGWLGIGATLQDRLIGGVAGFLAFELVRRLYRLLRHRDGMGGGDVRLFAAIGLWLGWRALPPVLLAASLTGLIWACALLARRRDQPVGKIPFGAFLALAAWIVWCVEQAAGPIV